MPWWKFALLHAYYYGTYPVRRTRDSMAAAAGRAPIIVLLYHRVADDAAHAWTISNAEFARHIDWLRRHFELVSLAEAQSRIRQPRNDRPCVALTFDDGYADNCRHALPLLVRLRVPCTYFVCSDSVLEGIPFQHDLQLGHRFEPNTLDELKALADAGIEIGAHTRTHANIAELREEHELRDEIIEAGSDLQRALGRPVRYFAFPFGGHCQLSARGFELAAEAGYEAACSAYGGYNFADGDAFHLQRISVDGPLIRVRNWVTVDPFRLLTVPRFDYGGLRPGAPAEVGAR